MGESGDWPFDFDESESYIIAMKKWKRTLIEAVVIVVVGAIVAFTHNAVSINGINPFRQLDDIPVVSGEGGDLKVGGEVNGIVFIDLEKAKEFFNRGVKILDARPLDAYRDGHIPNAILLDYYELGRYLEKVLPLLSMDEEIMVYCSGVDCDDSELLARELYSMGFSRLFVYKGGFEEWENSGMPVEKGIPGELGD